MDANEQCDDKGLSNAKRPRVFISHDSRDVRSASGFEILVDRVTGGSIECFRSSAQAPGHGIPLDSEWYQHIHKELRHADLVVAIITEASMGNPWIFYEIGFARGIGKPSAVIALGCSIEQLAKGPFSGLQICNGGENSLVKFIVDNVLPLSPLLRPDPQYVRSLVCDLRDEASANIMTNQAHSLLGAKPSEMHVVARLFEAIQHQLVTLGASSQPIERETLDWPQVRSPVNFESVLNPGFPWCLSLRNHERVIELNGKPPLGAYLPEGEWTMTASCPDHDIAFEKPFQVPRDRVVLVDSHDAKPVRCRMFTMEASLRKGDVKPRVARNSDPSRGDEEELNTLTSLEFGGTHLSVGSDDGGGRAVSANNH